jgi:hypothetical protein
MSDASGDHPQPKTLCKKQYDPADRIEASRGRETITEQLCTRCIKLIEGGHSAIRNLALAGGASEQEAVALADELCKLRRVPK